MLTPSGEVVFMTNSIAKKLTVGLWNAFCGLQLYVGTIPSRITGSAELGEHIPKISGIRHTVWAALFFVAGIIASWVGVDTGNVIMVVVGWISSIHGSRKLQLNIGHACAHGTVTGNEKYDKFLGRAIHWLVLATEFDSYQPEHTGIHHNWNVLATADDPTSRSL